MLPKTRLTYGKTGCIFTRLKSYERPSRVSTNRHWRIVGSGRIRSADTKRRRNFRCRC